MYLYPYNGEQSYSKYMKFDVDETEEMLQRMNHIYTRADTSAGDRNIIGNCIL